MSNTDDYDPVALGATLKRVRDSAEWITPAGEHRRGMTQSELARFIGVKQTAVSAWEVGRATPSLPNLWRLARVLNARMADLLETAD